KKKKERKGLPAWRIVESAAFFRSSRWRAQYDLPLHPGDRVLLHRRFESPFLARLAVIRLLICTLVPFLHRIAFDILSLLLLLFFFAFLLLLLLTRSFSFLRRHGRSGF